MTTHEENPMTTIRYIHNAEAANVAVMLAGMAVSEADRRKYGDMHVKCGECGTVVEARDAHEGPVCTPCWDQAGIENAHSDGHHDASPAPDCDACRDRADRHPYGSPEREAELIELERRDVPDERPDQPWTPCGCTARAYGGDCAHTIDEAFESGASAARIVIPEWVRRAKIGALAAKELAR